jgi:serine protease AprX
MVNAFDALVSTASACANQALDIAQDIEGNDHFFGPSNINEDGNFYVEGLGDEYIWNLARNTLDGSVLIWKNNFETDVLIWKNSATTDVLIWKNNFETDVLIWKNNVETDVETDVLIWKNSVDIDVLIWKNSIDVSEATTIGVNHWVEQL